jgi:chromosome segregation ATPase
MTMSDLIKKAHKLADYWLIPPPPNELRAYSISELAKCLKDTVNEVERLREPFDLAERFGFRPDVMALEMKRLDAKIERLEADNAKLRAEIAEADECIERLNEHIDEQEYRAKAKSPSKVFDDLQDISAFVVSQAKEIERLKGSGKNIQSLRNTIYEVHRLISYGKDDDALTLIDKTLNPEKDDD